jgi:hypothetical protein
MSTMTEQAPNNSIPYRPGEAAHVPLTERVNIRMLVFAGIVLFLLGWPIYTFLSETLTSGIHDRGSYKEVNLKALGQFDFEPSGGTVADVPSQYRALDGQKVLLEGEIYDPQEAGKDITEFQLVYSIQKCCFNGPPRVQERVYCTVPNGKLERRGTGYHKVLGTLHVTLQRVKLKDGRSEVVEVYHLDAVKVEPS